MLASYLIIGAGNTATHFQHYLRLLNISFQNWNRQQNTIDELLNRSQSASHILLLISDDAIEDFFHTHAFLKNKIVVHFSGCLSRRSFHVHLTS